MTESTPELFEFPRVCNRKVEADFNGGDITSDAGVLLLSQADRRLKLTKDLAKMLPDDRCPFLIVHSLLSLLRQRIYGIAAGYEDLNDHDSLRGDRVFQTAAGRDETLGGSSTLCRLENSQNRQAAVSMSKLIVEKFIASFDAPPKELILDFDATDDAVHGGQVGSFFNGYYKSYCFLPLYVFCEEQLLVSYLRTCRNDAAMHSWAILSLLVKRFRQEWPDVKIVFRADSGFCRWRMLSWCERNNVDYIVGISKNKRLARMSSHLIRKAEKCFNRTGRKAKLFAEIYYAACTWDKKRRIIAKAEHNQLGMNNRYVVTNMQGTVRLLYEKVYCARGDMENRIKEQQLDLFADRTSCHYWWPNQFRLLLTSMAYIILCEIRRTALKGTELANAQCSTIRLKLLKIGAVIKRNTRRVQIHMADNYPYKQLFATVFRRLARQ